MGDRSLSDLDADDWAGLEALSANELLRNIGRARGRGAIGHDLKEQGAKIYRRAREMLADRICTDPKVRAASQAANRSSAPALFAALGDIVTGYLSGVAGASFCVLLVKEGLPEFCASYWAAPDEPGD